MSLPEGAALPPGWPESRRAEAEQLWATYLEQTSETGKLLEGGNLENHLKANGLTEWIEATDTLQRRSNMLAYAIEQERIRREARRAVDAEEALERRQPVELISALDVWNEPDLTWLIDRWLPETGVGSLFGETGTWKTFLAVHLLLCVTTGRTFLGRTVARPGRAVYCMGEGQAGARRRLRAAVTDMGWTAPPIGLGYVKAPFTLDEEAAVTELIGQIRQAAGGQPVSLVLFDTVVDFYGPDIQENLAGDAQRIIAAAQRISRELGCFVLLIAHTGLAGERQRGTSRWKQAWDFEAQAERDKDKDGCGWVRVTKVKEDEKGQGVPFRVVASAGSLAVRHGHGDAGPVAGAQPDPELSATEERTLDTVMRYVIEHGDEDKDGLTFSRIDQGTKGTQSVKRQMLDLAVKLQFLEVTEKKRYRLPEVGREFLAEVVFPETWGS